MYKKGIVLSFVSCLIFAECIGQATNTSAYIPSVAQSTPEASAMDKFISYPVNLFTGIPGVSVPVYTIEVNGMQVPVTLNYHASGIKVSEEATWVGLGWSMDAGGAINRKKMGRPDEIANGYLNGPAIKMTGIEPYVTDYNYLNFIYNRILDGEPDIFSYSMPGKGGKFYYANQLATDPRIIPYAPIKINTTLLGTTMNFQLLDENGIEYKYGEVAEGTLESNEVLSYNSSFLLTKMISADKADTIKFNYVSEVYQSPGEYVDNIRVTDMVVNDPDPSSGWHNRYVPGIGVSQTSQTPVTVGGYKLQEIIFRNGKVVFERSPTNRTDLPYKGLNKIIVYSFDPVTQSYQVIRTVALFQSYFFNNANPVNKYRFRLDSVQIRNKYDVATQTYGFGYKTDIGLPDFRASRSKDYWGYYNNGGESTLVPYTQIVLESGGGGTSNATIGGPINNREPNPLWNQAYILNRMNLPTGGYTEYDYETNQYYDNITSTNKYAGGLRVKEIRSYDRAAVLSLKKTYKYGPNEDGLGKIIIPLSSRFFMTEQMRYPHTDLIQWHCRVRNYSSVPSVSADPYDGSPVGYDEVTEYNQDATNNSGKTTYKYDFFQDAFTSTFYTGNPKVVSNHFKRGLLREKLSYRKNSNGTYKLMEQIVNTYGAFPDNSTGAKSLYVFERAIYDSYTNWTGGSPTVPAYSWNSYSVMEGDDRLTSSTQTLYNTEDNTTIVNRTEYTFGSSVHYQPTQIKKYVSNGDIITINQTYPHNHTATPVYNKMVLAHIFSPVIEKTELLNSTQTIFTRTNYREWATNYLLPEIIQAQIGGGTLENRGQLYSYGTKSNPQQMAESGNINQSVIWDYQNTYPTAQVVNAAQADIAYAGFESDGKGNWTYTGASSLDPMAPTGKRFYNLTPSVPLTKSGLTAATIYTVSYWTKNASAFSITGTQSGYPISGRTINGWKYFEHKVTGQTTITFSGTGQIDEVRLYPFLSQMKTYSFQPLVGMTSQCDDNNRITYYEYDDLGRLMLVRDQDKNILKQLCYNYAGKPENCSVYYNAQGGGVYTRNNCSSGYFGTQVTYTVPAQTYSSNSPGLADAQVIADAQANGQAYANANGSCVLGITIRGYNAKSGSSYNVKFTPTGGGTSYTFLLPPGSTLQNLGAIPSGTYNVNFFPASGSSVNATFVVGAYSTSMTQTPPVPPNPINNVSITATTNAYMY